MKSFSLLPHSSKPEMHLSHNTMEQNTHFVMENPKKIIRKSIYTFLQNYQYFTSTPLLLIFPFSAFVLVSQALFSSSSTPFLTFKSLFYSQISQTNVFQTIFTDFFALLLSLTTLLIAKALVVKTILYPKSSASIPFSSFKSILTTQLCNSLLVIILNTISISLMYIIFRVGSSPNYPLIWTFIIGIFYWFFANASVICNLALVVSWGGNSFGFLAILKACSLIWNTNCATLLTNLPTNLSMFAVEALFGYRVVRAYCEKGFFEPSMGVEGFLIAYIYSILVVLDTTASCVFFKSCKENDQTDCIGPDCYKIVIVHKQDGKVFENSKISVVVQ